MISMNMKFQYNDGGRATAGYKGRAGDCVCRSIAIITGKPYQEVYDALNGFVKSKSTGNLTRYRSSARNSISKRTTKRYLVSLGFEWFPTMFIGQGCKVHVRAEELPPGHLIVSTSRHITAVIDGVLHDTYDCSRNATRCVYGYYVDGGLRHD